MYEDINFAAIVKRAWIYVGKANKETTTEDGKNWLVKKFPGRNFLVSLLNMHENAISSSFKVGADLDLLDQLNKGENWPSGLIIKPFKFFRYTQQKSSGQ